MNDAPSFGLYQTGLTILVHFLYAVTAFKYVRAHGIRQIGLQGYGNREGGEVLCLPVWCEVFDALRWFNWCTSSLQLYPWEVYSVRNLGVSNI